MIDSSGVTDDAQMRELVEGSGISHAVVRAAGLYTESDLDSLRRITKTARDTWTDAHVPALVFPYRDEPGGDVVSWTVKPRVPIRLKSGHTPKYVRTSGVGIHIYHPPSLQGGGALARLTEVLVTEGEKKTLSAETAGFPCLGLGGVDMWIAKGGSKKLHPTLEPLASAGVALFITFDSDRDKNLDVRRAEKALARAYAKAGGKAYVVRLPHGPDGKKQGLDDFLVAHGSAGPAQLRALMEQARKKGPEAEAEKVEAPATACACTDLGNAERFVRDHGQAVRWTRGRGWYVWSGTHWKNDPAGTAVQRLAEQTVRRIYEEAAAAETNDARADLADHAVKSESARAISAMVQMARSHVAVDDSAFDGDAYALNVANGTVDLRTGVLRAHRREDMLTSVSSVAYDPAATAPQFEAFLAQIQPEEEVRAYLARVFGYAAIGAALEHVLVVLWGSGRNGKGVLERVVSHVLGEHAVPGPSSLIVSSRHEPHPADLASLDGRRLVVVHETKRGVSFDASRVKMLTGGDRVKARRMHQDFYEFVPTHTLVMLSNYRPRADASDIALWRRVQLVLFAYSVPKGEEDLTLGQRIIEQEASGVLAWIVRGAVEWCTRRLDAPPSVLAQTAEYRESEDSVGAFVDECCRRHPVARTPSGELHTTYKKWCDANGHRALSGNDFSEDLQSRGFGRQRTRVGRFIVGLELRREGDLEGDAGDAVTANPTNQTQRARRPRFVGNGVTPSPPSPGDQFQFPLSEESREEKKTEKEEGGAFGDQYDARDWSSEVDS